MPPLTTPRSVPRPKQPEGTVDPWRVLEGMRDCYFAVLNARDAWARLGRTRTVHHLNKAANAMSRDILDVELELRK